MTRSSLAWVLAPVLAATAATAATPMAASTTAPSASAPAPSLADAEPALAVKPVDPSFALLRRAAPGLDPGVLALALEARACALGNGTDAGPRLAVIDYSLPSTEKRMWVLDVPAGELLYAEHVAHGQGSGGNLATDFSNRDGSHQTSLGLFTTAETYVGGNGYSLRMDGLEPEVNDNARERLIVIHGAPYVDPAQALRQGRLGRSYGCPALRPQVAREVIDTLKDRQMVFAYYPDPAWLAGSRYFGCSGRSAREIVAAAR